MIPNNLKYLVEQQKGKIHRTASEAVDVELDALGIPLNSQLAEFFRSYVITFFPSEVSGEELCDLLEPTQEVAVGTRFVHETWGLPAQYVCLSNIQGEGAYLYDTHTGNVWDFDLAHCDDFLNGNQKPGWMSYFDFMLWYLSKS